METRTSWPTHLPPELWTIILGELLVYAPRYDIQVPHQECPKTVKARVEQSINQCPRHTLVSHDTLTPPASTVEHRQVNTAILLTCRMLYTEGAPMLYGANVFIFRSLRHLRSAFLDKLRPETALHIRSLRFHDPHVPFSRSLLPHVCCEPGSVTCYSRRPTARQWLMLRNVSHVDFVCRFVSIFIAADAGEDRCTLRSSGFWTRARLSGRTVYWRTEHAAQVIPHQVRDVAMSLAWAQTAGEKPQKFIDRYRASRVHGLSPGDWELEPFLQEYGLKETMIEDPRFGFGAQIGRWTTRSSLWSAAREYWMADPSERGEEGQKILRLQKELSQMLQGGMSLLHADPNWPINSVVIVLEPTCKAQDE